MKTVDAVDLKIIDYRPEHQPWFEKLNREWIERYFRMEEVDNQVLCHPELHIIGPGGTVLIALWRAEVVGTVALKFVEPGIYEFTKMAVDERFRGKKIGLAVANAAIQRARDLNAEAIILYSNTRLVPAIALYRKLGFVEVPLDGPYQRSDIKMKLMLKAR